MIAPVAGSASQSVRLFSGPNCWQRAEPTLSRRRIKRQRGVHSKSPTVNPNEGSAIILLPTSMGAISVAIPTTASGCPSN